MYIANTGFVHHFKVIVISSTCLIQKTASNYHNLIKNYAILLKFWPNLCDHERGYEVILIYFARKHEMRMETLCQIVNNTWNFVFKHNLFQSIIPNKKFGHLFPVPKIAVTYIMLALRLTAVTAEMVIWSKYSPKYRQTLW